MGCVSQETVVAMMEGKLSDGDARQVDDHMDGCASCRALVAEVARGSLVRPIDGSHHPDDHLDEPVPTTALVRGQVLGQRYRIEGRLGRGGMGVVYKAHDLELGVTVALKLLPPEAAASRAQLDRLRQEIVLGRRITHPNVCRLYDFGHADGVYYISMEFLEGRTLAQCMAAGPIPEDDAAHCLAQICHALEAAHAHGVVHRDLKPANIMVSEDGRVSVMDFGLARDLTEDASDRSLLAGTPAYWSPEQAKGRKATPRSDIYTLGVIACELLTGKRPDWDAPVPANDLPLRYRDLVMRCLAVQPDDRFASAQDLREALAVARGQTGAALRMPKGRPLSLAIVGLVLLGLGVWVAKRIEPATSPARASAIVAEPPQVSPERPAPAAPVRTGPRRVTLEITPPDAQVREKGALIGVGLLSLAFEPGGPDARTLTIARPGYRSLTHVVRAGDGPTVQISLPRLSGTAATAPRAGAQTPGATPPAPASLGTATPDDGRESTGPGVFVTRDSTATPSPATPAPGAGDSHGTESTAQPGMQFFE